MSLPARRNDRTPYKIRQSWLKASQQAPELSATDRHVLQVVADHMNKDQKCWPGIECIGNKTGLGRRTVVGSLGKLVRLGWLGRKRRQHGYRRATNLYWLSWPEKQQELDLTASSKKPDLRVIEGGEAAHSECAADAPSYITTAHKNPAALNRAAATHNDAPPLHQQLPNPSAAADSKAPASISPLPDHVRHLLTLWSLFMAGYSRPNPHSIKTYEPEELLTALVWLIHRCNLTEVHTPNRLFVHLLKAVRKGEKRKATFTPQQLAAVAAGSHPLNVMDKARAYQPNGPDGLTRQEHRAPPKWVPTTIEDHMCEMFYVVDQYGGPDGREWTKEARQEHQRIRVEQPEELEAFCKEVFVSGRDAMRELFERGGKPVPAWFSVVE